MRPSVTVREASRQKGPFWLRNSRGEHEVETIHKVNGRLYHVLCKDGGWFALDPLHLLYRRRS